jgi:LysR family hydrogen peroxide-inducible transcriptional activator
MEIRQLKSLCLIAQYGSVKEAAKRSFLTSSAVSLQIKMLERELGIKLFERAGKKLGLTQRASTPRIRAAFARSARNGSSRTRKPI